MHRITVHMRTKEKKQAFNQTLIH